MLLGDKTVYLSNNHNLNVTFIVVSLNSGFILFSSRLHWGGVADSAYKPLAQFLIHVHTSEILWSQLILVYFLSLLYILDYVCAVCCGFILVNIFLLYLMVATVSWVFQFLSVVQGLDYTFRTELLSSFAIQTHNMLVRNLPYWEIKGKLIFAEALMRKCSHWWFIWYIHHLCIIPVKGKCVWSDWFRILLWL